MDGRLTEDEMAQVEGLIKPTKRVGFFSETDGSLSMRRLLSFVLVLGALALLGIAACKQDMTGVWAGVVALAGAVLILFFTTWESVAALVAAWKGRGGNA